VRRLRTREGHGQVQTVVLAVQPSLTEAAVLIAQISDMHIKPPGQLAYGMVDTAAMLQRCVADLCALVPQPDLIVLTGDLADSGQAEEYAYLRRLLAPLRAPQLVIPGNHDDRRALSAAFADHGYLPSDGFLQYAIDEPYPLRIVALDTVVPLEGRGEMCAERTAWLEAALARAPGRPTVILMHHPPFDTGIGHLDEIALMEGRAGFEQIVSRNSQVQLILCGHVHRPIHATAGGRACLAAPSTAHQVTLDLRSDASSTFTLEPPGYLLHWWNGRGFASHHATIGNYPGPVPF
jgi:3',5'-cyclic AMP phosphodiesterase CpdA